MAVASAEALAEELLRLECRSRARPRPQHLSFLFRPLRPLCLRRFRLDLRLSRWRSNQTHQPAVFANQGIQVVRLLRRTQSILFQFHPDR